MERAVADLMNVEEHESVSVGGVEVTFRLSGRETNDAYAVFEPLKAAHGLKLLGE